MLTHTFDALAANPAFATVCLALAGTVAALLHQIVISRSPLHGINATLKAENSTFQKKISDLEAKVLELQATIDTNFSRESIHLRFPIDPTTNLRKKDGHYFCPKCFPESLTEIIPKNGKYHCDKCNKKTTVPAFVGK